MARKKINGRTGGPAKIESIRHKDKRKNISIEELRDSVIDDGHGPDNPQDLVIEVPGGNKKDKVAAARMLWVPAINNHGGFGRWAFVEVDNPWDARNTIRTSLQKGTEL
jgi:hypothetical protein